MLAQEFIESLNVGREEFIFSINLGPELTMIAGRRADEIKPIQLSYPCIRKGIPTW
jgi:hypothetical protein